MRCASSEGRRRAILGKDVTVALSPPAPPPPGGQHLKNLEPCRPTASDTSASASAPGHSARPEPCISGAAARVGFLYNFINTSTTLSYAHLWCSCNWTRVGLFQHHLEPIEYFWSFLASGIGHLVPVWRPNIGLLIPDAKAPLRAMARLWSETLKLNPPKPKGSDRASDDAGRNIDGTAARSCA
jgi:hypothetical protein